MNLICPGNISNSTYDKCIGDILITSPKFIGTLFFGVLILLMMIWSFLYTREKFVLESKSEGVKE